MIEMDAREALAVALEALERWAEETDTASPEGHRVRLAIEAIERMADDDRRSGAEG